MSNTGPMSPCQNGRNIQVTLLTFRNIRSPVLSLKLIIPMSVLGSMAMNMETSKKAVRDWSLITGRGGLQNGRGGAREVLPLQKGGAEKVLATLKGGHKKFWGSFYAVA